MNSLRIVEIDYAVSPGGEIEYEVYSSHEEDIYEPPVYVTTSFQAACEYCYDSGQNFEVLTLKAWDAAEAGSLFTTAEAF